VNIVHDVAQILSLLANESGCSIMSSIFAPKILARSLMVRFSPVVEHCDRAQHPREAFPPFDPQKESGEHRESRHERKQP
jgi:hypothetical protein